MVFSGLTLPEIKNSDLNDEKERRKILEYLYQLTEQLRYTLSNLDEENLSQETIDKIDGAYEASSTVSREVRDVSGNVSSLKQFADSLTLSVENGVSSSSISLLANGVQIASQIITFTGDIVFKNNLTDGVTQISGGNITTGLISANRIDVDNLYARHLSAADGSFTGTLNGAQMVAAYGTFTNLTGTQYINLANTMHIMPGYIDANGIQIGYLSAYNDICMIPNGTSYGNIGIGSYYWDQVKATRFVDASSLRYKKNIRDLTDEDVGSVDDIRLVTYELKSKDSGERYAGIIAEELEETNKIFVNYDPEGQPDGIDYARMVVLTINEIKKLKQRVSELEGEHE